MWWRGGRQSDYSTHIHHTQTHNTCRARTRPRVFVLPLLTHALFLASLSFSRFSLSLFLFSLLFLLHFFLQVETFHHIAYKDTKVAANILIKQYNIADEAAEKDEAEHPLPNNASDSQKRDAELRRRVFVIFKSVDPEAIQRASGAIWSGCFAVVCALRVKFAHAVTLGVSIGDMTTGELCVVLQMIYFCFCLDHQIYLYTSQYLTYIFTIVSWYTLFFLLFFLETHRSIMVLVVG